MRMSLLEARIMLMALKAFGALLRQGYLGWREWEKTSLCYTWRNLSFVGTTAIPCTKKYLKDWGKTRFNFTSPNENIDWHPPNTRWGDYWLRISYKIRSKLSKPTTRYISMYQSIWLYRPIVLSRSNQFLARQTPKIGFLWLKMICGKLIFWTKNPIGPITVPN